MKLSCNQVSHAYPNLCVQLSQYRLIDIAGADAEKYLQGQLTCDVAKIEVGSHTLTSHCDPKGKMSALLRLYRAESDKFVAIIHTSLLPEALTQLKKYAVFSKVTFTELDTPVYGIAGEEAFAKLPENVTALTLSQGQKRAFVWGENLEPNADERLWTLMDIQDGVPVLLKENQFEIIPQAANLQLLENAISFTKGCYIGQETVARAKYRGANKRALFTLVGRFEGEITLPETASAIEMQLGENWRATGTVLTSVAYENTLWVQVVMNKDVEPDAQFRVNSVTLQLYELPYSLEEN
ncbi:folate-binding protein [Mannheimia varigena]|uniref:CAF17-like 4Fe-4S cluster assembly/insertion protein YgfZ n=1 Tax=Mannheimia varigena TaxID=85404 RepID=UPI0015B39DC8|nr:folate-binding protein [Mannheimia varigena]QLD33697.1 folate-binding protein [Mannheimia varigena]